MIISHKYKFIFIKTGKTAGTSIELYLSKFCGKNDICTTIIPDILPPLAKNYKGFVNPIPELIENRGHGYKWILLNTLKFNRYYEHISGSSIKSHISKDIWKNYFKFCVDRNPWDKTISHYYMVNSRLGNHLTFDQYLKRGKFPHNLKFYTARDNSVLVDKIIKYESLNNELKLLFKQLEIPFNGTLGIQAKSHYRKDHRHYRAIYNDSQRAIIEKAFKKELVLNEYNF